MLITPYDAMWREIGCLYRALEHERAALEREVSGLDAPALHAPIDAKAPSIAALLLGCGVAEAAWVHERWRKAPVPPPPSGTPALEAILRWLHDVREATRLALMKATDADLDRRVVASPDGLASLRWILHQLLAGAAAARGQVSLIRALRK